MVHKHWVSKPRTILKTINVTPQEFALNFCTSGRIFLHHSFIANEQVPFINFQKKNLQSDECLVVCDFAENYAFVIQNVVPGFHWNNNQATLFPIVFYYNENGSIKHETVVIISDCTKHDAVGVYVFLQGFNEFLDLYFPNIRKWYLFFGRSTTAI